MRGGGDLNGNSSYSLWIDISYGHTNGVFVAVCYYNRGRNDARGTTRYT